MRLALLGLDGHGDNLGALACEQLGPGLADTGGAAGDQDDSSFKTHGLWLLSFEFGLRPRRTCPLAAELNGFIDQRHDIVLRPVAEHVAGFRRVDAEIQAHRVDQIERFQAQPPGRAGRRFNVVERIVHGDHEGLPLDPVESQGQQKSLHAVLHGHDVAAHGRPSG